jgi:carbon-monoxide dehydrogenase medium subunit
VPYIAPASVDEARQILAANPQSQVFAGATDMLPQAKAGKPLPEVLIDLKTIPRLVSVTADNSAWTIGAATPAATLAAHHDLAGDFPGLVEAVGLIGSDQIQSRASLGGNLCNASPAADTGPSLRVNDATAIIASPDGERAVAVDDLTVGPGRTSLEPGEFVIEFVIERPRPRSADAYLRFTPRTEMDIAVVGAAARVGIAESGECTSADVVLAAVAPTTVRVEGVAELLVGRPLDEAALEAVAALSREACDPIDDKRGTREFRLHLSGVLTKRVLGIAAERAVTR